MSHSRNWRLPLFWLFCPWVCRCWRGLAFAADGVAEDGSRWLRRSARPGHAAIASANFLATNAGFEVLAKGGNAFDAAVAVASTLSVVEPESSGIGGGFMAVLHRASDGHDVFIDARETAPAAVECEGLPRSRTAARTATPPLKGPLSAGIPGEPAGLVLIGQALRHACRCSSRWRPAIRIARDGFQPDPRLRGAIAAAQEDLRRWPASAAKYLPDGKPPAEGATLARSGSGAHAGTARRARQRRLLSRARRRSKLVAAVQAAGGNWTLADLAGYQAKERKPITVDYRGFRIVTAPPPSSGGVAIAEILNILVRVRPVARWIRRIACTTSSRRCAARSATTTITWVTRTS